ncbi:MAG TPA: hypothetical protein VN625_04770 [Desulfuromonadaceae bacterium]|nr:hypothetical protein [Desulfuromonadaceae bacterium]
MTEDIRNEDRFDPLRRYVPLVVWMLAALVIVFTALKIIGYGYLPYDDALIDAAKAISGKSWQDILVLGPIYAIDHHFGWHWLLVQIHAMLHCTTDGLVAFEVVTLFLVCCGLPLVWLKRPEAWLGILVFFFIWSGFLDRVVDGRPLIITMTALFAVLFLWQRSPAGPGWREGTAIFLLLVIAFFLHGVWYLWALPVAAFFLAQQYRWGLWLAAMVAVAFPVSLLMTGHPIELVSQTVRLALHVESVYVMPNTRVHEMRPTVPQFIAVLVLAGLAILRRLAKLDALPFHRSPAFWLAAMSWVLATQTGRFWIDWGLPGLMVLAATDLQLFLEKTMAVDSLKRVGLAACLSVAVYAVATDDFGGRWTHNLRTQYLTPDNPDLQGWLPEKDGIIYTTDMSVFYQTFYKNPTADWRYIVGFEPAYMAPADIDVYSKFIMSNGDPKTLTPWIERMRPEDRFITRAPRQNTPDLPKLEWNYGLSGIWIGRTPRPVAGGTVPPTVPAHSERSTNAVPAAPSAK